MFEVGTGCDAEFEVSFVVEDGITIKGQFSELLGILERIYVIEFLNSVVGEEDALESGAMGKPLH